ncbi:hypothetical protein, partial [Burkholderia cenocepacia]|uniref:hypothetical protein n=1 Tax=Burkholderia cenocepacia TaxID=95486 RepID=UPI0028757836
AAGFDPLQPPIAADATGSLGVRMTVRDVEPPIERPSDVSNGRLFMAELSRTRSDVVCPIKSKFLQATVNRICSVRF